MLSAQHPSRCGETVRICVRRAVAGSPPRAGSTDAYAELDSPASSVHSYTRYSPELDQNRVQTDVAKLDNLDIFTLGLIKADERHVVWQCRFQTQSPTLAGLSTRRTFLNR